MHAFHTIREYKNSQPHPVRREGGLRTRGKFYKSSQDAQLVSVITIVKNSEHTLERTVQSVLSQSYNRIEYIIIDGASTDRTLDILSRYDDHITYWLSEPDKGISDAFNKGIAVSTGDFICLLNADDWLSREQIEQSVHALQNSSADYVFGDLLFHDENGRILYRINGDPDYRKIIHSKMSISHPTVLARRQAYERVGLFDTRYDYAMDYEWLLRLHTQGGTGMHVKEIIGHMGIGGVSESSYRKTLKEVRDIAVSYGQQRWLANCLYIFRIIKGALRRFLEDHAPKRLYHVLRKKINRKYTSQIQ